MAMYEYICQKCGHKDDLILKMDDPSLTVCPKCDEESFCKQVSAPHFKLSGSGWYETDFKNKKEKKPSSTLKKEKKKEKKND